MKTVKIKVPRFSSSLYRKSGRGHTCKRIFMPLGCNPRPLNHVTNRMELILDNADFYRALIGIRHVKQLRNISIY